MPNSWSNSSILSPNRSILHRVYLVFDKWTDSGPDFSVFPESDLSTFIAWSGAHEGNLYWTEFLVTASVLPGSGVFGSRAGHVTSRNAASGPRKSVRRNHVHADRFRVRAYPPASIATVNQTNATAELSQVMR